jgi:plasmid stabilization system protein ParE
MTPAAVRFDPAAAQEAESAYDWFAARNPSAAHGFREKLRYAVDAVADSHARGPAMETGRGDMSSRDFPSSWFTGCAGTKSKSWPWLTVDDGRATGGCDSDPPSNSRMQRPALRAAVDPARSVVEQGDGSMPASRSLNEDVKQHYTRPDLGTIILTALASAGKDLDALKPEDLAPIDQFHIRGRQATLELAQAAGVDASQYVLDVGSGIGGPSRSLAQGFGCRVAGIDLTDEYCRVATMLAERVGLS